MTWNTIQARIDALRGLPGAGKFMAGAVACAVLVAVNLWLWSVYSSMTAQNAGRHTRLAQLLVLGEEYKARSGSGQNKTAPSRDVAAVFAQITERMQLGGRVSRITPEGANQSVEIHGLYAEELAEIYRQLRLGGVRIIACELRTLPSGSERLFTLSAVIGPNG